jgi:hypothetical protein
MTQGLDIMHRIIRELLCLGLTALCAAAATNASAAPAAVQIDIRKLLNFRVITTLVDGKVVPL